MFKNKPKKRTRPFSFLSVRPKEPTVIGADQPLKEGQLFNISCHVNDSKPAAHVEFFRWSTGKIINSTSQITKNANGTYDVTRSFQVLAHPDVDKEEFICQATNNVMESKKEPPMKVNSTITVHCKFGYVSFCCTEFSFLSNSKGGVMTLIYTEFSND